MTGERLKGIVLVPTYRCNLSCDYCYNPPPRDMHTVLPIDAGRKILVEAQRMGAESLDLVGGEPSILPLNYLKDLLGQSDGMKKGVSTNGLVAISRPEVAELFREFDVIQVSIHPFRFSKSELTSHVTKLASMIRSLRKDSDSVVVNMVIDARTAQLLGDEALFDSMGKALEGLTKTLEMNVANLVGHAAEDRTVVPSVSEILALRSRVPMLESVLEAHRIKLSTNLKTYFLPRPNLWGKNAVVLDPYGNVLPLDESTIDIVHFGIVRFGTWRDPLEEIWNESDSMNLFRGEEWLPASCRSCPILKWCRGGNRVDALLVGGDLFGENPFCLCSARHLDILRAYHDQSALGRESIDRFYDEAVESLKSSRKVAPA